MNRPDVPATLLGDVEKSIDHYLSEAGVAVADRFLVAVIVAIRQIEEQLGIGSPRLATILRRPDLRVWPIRGFPYLIFYNCRGRSVELWRMIHSSRDIPATLRE